MPLLQPIALSFLHGLHVGTRGVNLDEAGIYLPSDTLFSALVDTWRRMGGAVEDWMAPFIAGTPPFLLTSAFPYAGKVRFYPVPVDLRRLLVQEAGASGTGKTLKRIRFLSEGILRRTLAGDLLPENFFSRDEAGETRSGVSLQSGTLWLLPEEVAGLPDDMRLKGNGHPRPVALLPRQQVWAKSRTPRVTVDRIGSASNIFHAGRTRFADGCGLWFGVGWRQPAQSIGADGEFTYQTGLNKALAVLGDEGIGGERTAGYGVLTATPGAPFDLPNPVPGEVAWLLSRYLPTPTELTSALGHPQAAYQISRVGGWVRSLDSADQRRKQVMLVNEGSLIGWPAADTVGSIADLRPDYNEALGELPHSVYRSGLALALGLAPQ